MDRVRVTFWGVRGSIPAPGRETMRFGGNTACVEIVAGETRIICDAGSGIRALGLALMRCAGRRPIAAHILLSHLHWDHYMGLPFFTPLYERRNRFVIAGPAPGRTSFGKALSKAMRPPYFPIPFSAIPAGLAFRTLSARPFAIGGVRVVPMGVHHPGGALGWRFEFKNGSSLVHVTDNEPAADRQIKRQIAWMKEADVLIHDAQYNPRNYRDHRGWGHSPFTYPLFLAEEADIKRLFLFHFDPQDEDRQLERVLRKAREMASSLPGRPEVDLAREGASFTL